MTFSVGFGSNHASVNTAGHVKISTEKVKEKEKRKEEEKGRGREKE